VRPTPNGIARGAIAMRFGSGLGAGLNSIRSRRALMRTRIASRAVAIAGGLRKESRRNFHRHFTASLAQDDADARTVRIRQFPEFGLESARDAAAQVAQQASVNPVMSLIRTGRRIA
jgi:hypothetical protein